MHFDRTLLWIPTGCALRWAQKDEGRILGWPQGTRIVAMYHRSLRFPTLRLPVSPTRYSRFCSLSDSRLGALRAWVALGCRPDLPEGFLSPRSTLVGQGSSDSPPGCHSLLPQFDKAEPSDSLFRFAPALRFLVCNLFPKAKQGWLLPSLFLFISVLPSVRSQTHPSPHRKSPAAAQGAAHCPRPCPAQSRAQAACPSACLPGNDPAAECR